MSDPKVRWRVGLWSSKKRVWVTFPFDRRVIEMLKERVPGGRWDSKEKFWHFPLDMDVCRDIRSVADHFGFGLAIEPELASWARKEKTRYSHVLAPEANTDQWQNLLPRLQSERPVLFSAMRDIATKADGTQGTPWQILGAAFMAAQKRVLLADQPGLGKTIQTLSAVAELGISGCILVVAPRSAVAVTWPEEIAQWLGEDEKIFVINATIKPAERREQVRAARDWAAKGNRSWVLCGPNYLRIKADVDDNTGDYLRDDKGNKIIRAVNECVPDLFGVKWSAVIVDESHQTLAGATGNKKRQSSQRLGLGALDTAPDALRIAISGTPFRGKTENLWGTLNWLYPDKYTSYWNWIKRHYGIKDSGSSFGSGIVKGDNILDEKRFFSELKPVMVRRTKAEVRESLPPKMYGGTHLDPNDPTTPVAVWLPMSPKQEKQYREIEREALINIGGEDEITVNGVLAEMTRCKQIANSCLKTDGFKSDGNPKVVPVFPSNKAEWIHDFLVDRIENGTKTIVASQFTGFLNTLSAELEKKGIKHYLYTGATNEPERKRIRKEFQSESGDMVVLLNTKSGGVSLTLDLADDVVIVDQTWIPDDQEQVEDRAHRVSRNHNVVIWNLASLGTIDEDIAVLNTERGEAISSILEKQRGVSYAKKLYAKVAARVDKRESDKQAS
ncbi:gp60 [Mycobacterium phage Predator]|uniref:Helicase n=1 Tax=Mycobacterium phage Predator TaxID=543153 RepID=B3VM87_9CAUD|nr:gp60 [Mycobacterium phage Predator]ACF05157.1 helicase [Mycobacterium phage Predator]